jgi:hypothetical protein
MEVNPQLNKRYGEILILVETKLSYYAPKAIISLFA